MRAAVAHQDIALISRSMVRQKHWLEPQITSSELSKRLQISKPAFTDSFISERFRTTLKSVYPSVGKSGLIRLLWEQEIEGSNPSTRTTVTKN